MATYLLERTLDGERWNALAISPYPFGPYELTRPAGEFPVNDKIPAFAGLPGAKCRLRKDDVTLEMYSWDRVPLNPMDQDSEMVWGWRLLEKKNEPDPAGYGRWMAVT